MKTLLSLVAAAAIWLLLAASCRAALKTLLTLVASVVIVCIGLSPNRADAAPRGQVLASWEVQVKYWFFDTTHSH